LIGAAGGLGIPRLANHSSSGGTSTKPWNAAAVSRRGAEEGGTERVLFWDLAILSSTPDKICYQE
jgi:hypothetical protein